MVKTIDILGIEIIKVMEQCDFLFSLCGKKNNQAETVFLCGKNSLTETVYVWHPLKSSRVESPLYNLVSTLSFAIAILWDFSVTVQYPCKLFSFSLLNSNVPIFTNKVQ
jgi:hypothetical protein